MNSDVRELQRKITQVNLELLTNVFEEQEFQRNLRSLVRLDNFGIESGFNVYKDFFSDEYFVGHVVKGNKDGVSINGGNFSPKDDCRYFSGNYCIIMGLHSHDDSLCPSTIDDNYSGDLSNLNIAMASDLIIDCKNNVDEITTYICQNRRLEAICLRDKQDIKILLLQQKSSKMFPLSIIRDIGIEIYGPNEADEPNDKELIDRINRTGFYRAELVTLAKQGFSKEDLSKLKRFEYTPRLVERRLQ